MYAMIRDHAGVQRLSDGALIPSDSNNSDWREYLAWVQAGNSAKPSPLPALSEVRAARVGEAFATMQSRVASAEVFVTTAAGTHAYGLDAVTQDNLQKALLGVLTGISPNPRLWTPKGAAAPITISHDDVKTIVGAVGFAYEAHVQAYLAHKRAIAALATTSAVIAYDLTQGWPA